VGEGTVADNDNGAGGLSGAEEGGQEDPNAEEGEQRGQEDPYAVGSTWPYWLVFLLFFSVLVCVIS